MPPSSTGKRSWILSGGYRLGGLLLLPTRLLLLIFGNRPAHWFKFDPQNLSLKNVLSAVFFAGFGVAAMFLTSLAQFLKAKAMW